MECSGCGRSGPGIHQGFPERIDPQVQAFPRPGPEED